MNRLRNSFFLAWITLILSSVPALSQSGGVVELDRIFIEHDVHSGFGEDVDFAGDLDGDGVPEILIGAPSFDAGGLWSAGAVYVFSGATGALIRRIDGWEQYASFGRAVCNPGDVNGDGVDDILIGAQDAPQTGSAYLYSGASFQILHHFQGNVFQGAFGYSVAGAGDVDGNGLPDVIVGAPGPRSQKGSVFVYSGQTGALLHQIDPKGRVEDFGFSVSTAGDVNQDGHDDLLIGAPVTWHGIRKGGSAFIYSGKGGHLLFQVDGLYEEGRFGESVAYVGDINGDGYPDHAVGSPGAEATKKESGAVFVFSGADGSQIYFEPGRKVNQKLGYDVSYAGDVDGDGFPDILASSGWGRRYIANRELVSGLFVISGADGEIDFTQLTAIPSKSHLAGFFPVGLMERSGICPTGKSSKFRRS